MTDAGRRSGITAPGAIVIAFTILLEGVTNGDYANADSRSIYVTAAVTLALAGFLFFQEDVLASRGVISDSFFSKADGAFMLATTIEVWTLRAGVQVSVLVIAWKLCDRFGREVTAAFILTLLAVATAAAVLVTILRYSALALILSQELADKQGRTSPPWIRSVVRKLTERYPPEEGNA